MNWMELPGFWQPHDWYDYTHLVNEIPDGGTLIEIGSFRGKSLCSIAETLIRKNIRVISVDLFDVAQSPGYHEPEVQNNRSGMLADFNKNIVDFSLAGRVMVYAKPSTEAAVLVNLENIQADMIFIDADHSYEAVKADIESWWPLVKEGGILAGHDYDHNAVQWPGVHQAVHEAFGQPAFGVYIAAVRKVNGKPWPQVGLWKN